MSRSEEGVPRTTGHRPNQGAVHGRPGQQLEQTSGADLQRLSRMGGVENYWYGAEKEVGNMPMCRCPALSCKQGADAALCTERPRLMASSLLGRVGCSMGWRAGGGGGRREPRYPLFRVVSYLNEQAATGAGCSTKNRRLRLTQCRCWTENRRLSLTQCHRRKGVQPRA